MPGGQIALDPLDCDPANRAEVATTEPVELGRIATCQGREIASEILGIDERGAELVERLEQRKRESVRM